MRLFRLLLWTQSVYYLFTAIWPLLDIKSFMAVTGPKTDIWLVKTVGAMLIPVSITLGSYLFIRTDRRPAILLGGFSALAFMTIDFYYALKNVISDIYMLDGVLQIILLVGWTVVITKNELLTNKKS